MARGDENFQAGVGQLDLRSSTYGRVTAYEMYVTRVIISCSSNSVRIFHDQIDRRLDCYATFTVCISRYLAVGQGFRLASYLPGSHISFV